MNSRRALVVIPRWLALAFLFVGMSGATAAAAGPFAYVANSGAGTISVIDTSTNAVVNTISTGGSPYGVAVNAAGTRVYVTDPGTNVVKVIDTMNNAVVATIAVSDAPFGIAVNPSGTRAYVSKFSSAQLAVIDAMSNTVIGSPIEVGRNPQGVVVNAADTRAYVVDSDSAQVHVIDTATATVVTAIAVTGAPRQIALNGDGTRAYVSECNGNRVVEIDTGSNTVVGSIAVQNCPDGIAINPAGDRVYVANSDNTAVSVIDTGTNAVVATVPVGTNPHGLSVTANGGHVYVTNYSSNNVSVIDASTNTVSQTVSVGNGPQGVVVTPPPVPTTLTVAVPPSSIYPGDSFVAGLNIQHAVNLYAAQVECQVDAAFAVATSAVFGGLFDPVNRLVAANNALGGSWLGGISQQNPAGPITGDGLLATLTLTAQQPGTRTISCVPILADRNGLPLPSATTTPPSFTVLPFAHVDGAAKYQGRTAHSAIDVTATGPVTKTGLTNAGGQFAVQDLKAGTYEVRVDAPGYLPACKAVSLAIGESRTLEPALILGGDINDDGAINIADATLVGANFGSTVPPADARADINKDGVVNVQDLALLAGNYGLAGCQAWGGGE